MNPGKKSKRLLVLLALMPVIILLVKAQSNLVFYHTNDQFNSSNFNPAFLTSQKKFTFSILPLAGISRAYNNQSVNKDIIQKIILSNQTGEDLKDIFNTLVNQDLFYQRVEISLLNFGFNSAIGSFRFLIRENMNLLSDFNGEFSEFVMSPTFQTVVINQPQSFPANAVHYREYSLGYAREIIKNKLSVGVRAKLYFGKSSIFSAVEGTVIKESGNFYMQIYGPLNLSIPLNKVEDNGLLRELNLFNNFTLTDYLLNSKNLGTGLDFGVSYKITPEIMLSASVVDLGKISWKNNLNTLNFNGKYEFSKQSVSEDTNRHGVPILIKNYDDISLSDSISQLFEIIIEPSAYSNPLPATLYAGLQYKLNPKVNIGVVDRFIKTKGLNHNSFSLTASYEVNKKLSISSGYSMIGNSFFNIPLAILYNWNWGQAYIGSDNVFSYLFPSFSDFSGITFGTCLYLFSNKVKYKEPLEYLPFYKEKKTRKATEEGLIFNKSPEP